MAVFNYRRKGRKRWSSGAAPNWPSPLRSLINEGPVKGWQGGAHEIRGKVSCREPRLEGCQPSDYPPSAFAMPSLPQDRRPSSPRPLITFAHLGHFGPYRGLLIGIKSYHVLPSPTLIHKIVYELNKIYVMFLGFGNQGLVITSSVMH